MANIEMIDDIGIGGAGFSARTAVAISGGMWARATSGSWSAAVASTGTVAAYDTNTVTLTSVAASGTSRAIGLALQDTASGTSNVVDVFRNGTVILRANAAVTAGALVAASNAGAATALIADSAAYGDVVGQAYTACGSNEFAVVQLRL